MCRDPALQQNRPGLDATACVKSLSANTCETYLDDTATTTTVKNAFKHNGADSTHFEYVLGEYKRATCAGITTIAESADSTASTATPPTTSTAEAVRKDYIRQVNMFVKWGKREKTWQTWKT